MTWLARLKKAGVGSDTDPAKPTKPGFASFAGTPVALAQNSGGNAQAANDPAHDQDFDLEAILKDDAGQPRPNADAQVVMPPHPDRYSWPHTKAMNTAEIEVLTARLHLFTQHGLGYTYAERLADGLVIRDRELDDRRLCMECCHLRAAGTTWSCSQWRRAKMVDAGLARELVELLQRCSGFNQVAL